MFLKRTVLLHEEICDLRTFHNFINVPTLFIISLTFLSLKISLTRRLITIMDTIVCLLISSFNKRQIQQDLHIDEIYLQHIIGILFIYRCCTKKKLKNSCMGAHKYKNTKIITVQRAGPYRDRIPVDPRYDRDRVCARLLPIARSLRDSSSTRQFYLSSVVGPSPVSFSAPRSLRDVRRCTEGPFGFEVVPGERWVNEHPPAGIRSRWLCTRLGRSGRRRQCS